VTQQTRRETFQTPKASQIVAGGQSGQSEAATPGSKNAITQSILKGCQISSYQVLRTVEGIGVAVAAPLMETSNLACKNASRRCYLILRKAFVLGNRQELLESMKRES